jgi:hypothetical protein
MMLEQDVEVLRLFNEKVERLESTGLARFLEEDMPNVSMTVNRMISSKQDGPNFEFVGVIRSTLDNVDQDHIDAFVLTYRMFVQKNDRVSLVALSKIYERDSMPAEAAESFREATSEVETYLASTLDVEFSPGQAVTRRHLVDTILYGALAHSNHEKEREFRVWTESGGLTGFVWAEFIVALERMLFYLKFFRQLNEAVIANHPIA